MRPAFWRPIDLFEVRRAIVAHPDINWVGCCNELNAAYGERPVMLR